MIVYDKNNLAIKQPSYPANRGSMSCPDAASKVTDYTAMYYNNVFKAHCFDARMIAWRRRPDLLLLLFLPFSFDI